MENRICSLGLQVVVSVVEMSLKNVTSLLAIVVVGFSLFFYWKICFPGMSVCPFFFGSVRGLNLADVLLPSSRLVQLLLWLKNTI